MDEILRDLRILRIKMAAADLPSPPAEAPVTSNAAHNRQTLFSGIGDTFRRALMKYKPVLPRIEFERVPGYLLKRPVGTPPKGTPMMLPPKDPPSLLLRGMMAGYNRRPPL